MAGPIINLHLPRIPTTLTPAAYHGQQQQKQTDAGRNSNTPAATAKAAAVPSSSARARYLAMKRVKSCNTRCSSSTTKTSSNNIDDARASWIAGLPPVRNRSLRRRSCALQAPLLPTEAEFLQLPGPIQRKCFSSVERLRIAQQSQQPLLDPSYFGPPSACPSRTFSARRIRLKNQRALRDEDLLAYAQAQWFLSLPDKIRRQHFSREEQILLAGRVDLNLASARPSTAVGEIRRRSIPPQRRHSFTADSLFSATPTKPTGLRSTTTQIRDMNCFDPTPSSAGRPRRPSFTRRHLSLSRTQDQTMLRLSSSSSSPGSPFFPQHSRARSAGTLLVRSSIDSVALPFDQAAVHYKDPEARSKLRRYLASPQKFDEAIEFGFPSAAATVQTVDPVKKLRTTSSNDAHTFLKDDVISFIDRYDEDSDDGVDDLSSDDSAPASPATPDATGDMDSAFRVASDGTYALFSSLDSTNLPPLNLVSFKSLQSKEPDFSIVNREMTLRMTLTRPDLRAPEEELYGWQLPQESSPLALEELPPPTDDATGAKGAFAVKTHRNSGVLKRLFCRNKQKEKRN